MKHLIKTLIIAASIAAAPLMAAPPPKYIDVDANFQQSQELEDLSIQQGGSMRLRLRHKVDGSWPTLTGNTARWEARQQMTNTSAYTATSNLTSNEAHFIQFDLNNVQTGTSLTNWFYSIILVDGGEDYPIGVGTLNIIASDFAGSSGILVGSGYETNGVDVTDTVSTINFGSGITATHDGTNKLTVTVAETGDITAVNITAGTGIETTVLTASGDHDQTIQLNAASIASLALADSAIQTTDIDTYAELDAIVSDKSLLNQEDDFSANGLSLVSSANYSTMRALLDLEAGTDFYSKTAEDTWRSSVSQTEMGYVDGVTSDIQTQINTKLEWASAPATATSTGTAGQIAYDSNYIYWCVSTDVWRRSAGAAW